MHFKERVYVDGGAPSGVFDVLAGFRLLTKAWTTGVINLTRLVPLVGGLIGGSVDGYLTHDIGMQAKRLFKKVEGHG